MLPLAEPTVWQVIGLLCGSEFIVRISPNDASKVVTILRKMPVTEVRRRQHALAKVQKYFSYQGYARGMLVASLGLEACRRKHRCNLPADLDELLRTPDEIVHNMSATFYNLAKT